MSQVPFTRITNSIKVPKILQRLVFRVTCVSWLVAATFFIYIIQEFTYVLNYQSNTTKDTLEDVKPFALKYLSKNKLASNSVDSQRKEGGKVIDASDDWRKINDDIYVYSAYWDTRLKNNSFVRIIAGVKIPSTNLNQLKCLLSRDGSFELYLEFPTTHEFFPEDHGKSSRAAFIMCSRQNNIQPNFVALVPDQWNKTWKYQPRWMEVHRIHNIEAHFGVGVCVRPMFNYSDTFRIVEFVAYYEALGADHFIFYNYDACPQVKRIIRYLQASNYSVDWYPWTLPSDLHDMWSLGQVANINDCIYRHMGSASYIAVVDLDEFITPRHAMTIADTISAHDVACKKSGSFVIRNCFFCLEYEQFNLPGSFPKFVTQTRIRREKKVWPFYQRSKYIVKPDQVIIAGIHFVWKHMPEVTVCLMKASQVLVHHYRAKI